MYICIYIYIYTHTLWLAYEHAFIGSVTREARTAPFEPANHVIFFFRMSGCCHCYCERLENYSRLSDYTVRLEPYRMIGQK